jgi:RNA polymerase sigma-70 factor (ECF subfamily)
MADGSMGPEAFDRLMAEQRPRLHRYCARMVGSTFDGEDVLQEALIKAAEAYPSAGSIEAPERWLMRIAHNTALDALRRRKRQAAVDADIDVAGVADRSAVADARVAAAASLATLLRLPAVQRACVVLVDVLGYSLVETVEILESSLAAVKAALHRARGRLRALADGRQDPASSLPPAELARLRDYADRFNARDFDALRALLAEDVRLDLVNRLRLAGRDQVQVYFSRYSERSNWRFWPGLAEGQPALLVTDPSDPAETIRNVVLLGWEGGRIATIRDFFYATYATDGLAASRL